MRTIISAPDALAAAGGAFARRCRRGARRWRNGLKLSNAERARLEDLAGGGRKNRGASLGADVRRLLYRIGRPRFRDRVLLSWAASAARRRGDPWRMLLSIADGWERPRFPLTGREVMAAGVAEGPEVGHILAAGGSLVDGTGFSRPIEAQLLEKLKSADRVRFVSLQAAGVSCRCPAIRPSPMKTLSRICEHAALVLDGATPLGPSLVAGPQRRGLDRAIRRPPPAGASEGWRCAAQTP